MCHHGKGFEESLHKVDKLQYFNFKLRYVPGNDENQHRATKQRIMRKACTVLLIFWIAAGGLRAQSSLDSLRAVWLDTTRADTTRAFALEDYIYTGYFYPQPDSALLLTRQLLAFTRNTGNEAGEVTALKTRGVLLFRLGQMAEALTTFRRGVAIADSMGYAIVKGDILARMGMIYHDNSDFMTAMNYYEKSLRIFEEEDDLIGKGTIYNEYGSIYRERDEFEKSLDYYLKSIDIVKQRGDSLGLAPLYANVGGLYLNQRNYARASSYFERSLAIYRQKKDQLGIASSLAGIGSMYGDQGNYPQALDYLQQSLAISKEMDDLSGWSSTLLDMANLYVEQNDYRRAIRSAQESLELAKILGDIGRQEIAHEYLYEGYKGLGNATKALFHHEQMLDAVDSLQMEDTALRLQQMEFQKEVVQDSMETVARQLETEMAYQAELRQKDRNRNLAIAGGLFFLLLSGGLFSRWRYVRKAKAIIEEEKRHSDELLLNILPAEVAEELKNKGQATARNFDMASILFTDFQDFTAKAEELSATELLYEVNNYFRTFDYICEKYGIEKIKTIGDAYMAAGGLPVPTADSIRRTILAALEMQSFMLSQKIEQHTLGKVTFDMRCGIHTGPAVAGIVGVKKFQYDVWGDTVNIASRMESSGEAGKVNISQATYEFVKDDPQFRFEQRGKIEVKGKGEIEMWFVELAG